MIHVYIGKEKHYRC